MLTLPKQDRGPALCDRNRCLRYRAPELRVVAEKDASPAPFQRLQPVKRGQHRLAVVHVARQAALAKGLTEVAGVRGEHDLTAIKPQPKGWVPRVCPYVGRHTTEPSPNTSCSPSTSRSLWPRSKRLTEIPARST